MNEHDHARKVIAAAEGYPVVVSLGAYRGEDDAEFAKCGRNFLHILVEPDPDNCKAIRALKGRHARRLVEAAISDHGGSVTFWRSHDRRDNATGSGSILRPTGHLDHFPTITFSDAITVPCFKLDDLFTTMNLTTIDLLWVDIQGAEARMIRGGQNALKRTRYLMIEMESIEFYEGQTLKPDLLRMLPDWTVIEDFGFNVFLSNKIST